MDSDEICRNKGRNTAEYSGTSIPFPKECMHGFNHLRLPSGELDYWFFMFQIAEASIKSRGSLLDRRKGEVSLLIVQSRDEKYVMQVRTLNFESFPSRGKA